MQEGNKLLWKVRIIICLLVLTAGLILRFAVGGGTYQSAKVWYQQQLKNSVQPSLSLENIQKQCHDFLASGASIVTPQFGSSQGTASSSSSQGKANSSKAAASAESKAPQSAAVSSNKS